MQTKDLGATRAAQNELVFRTVNEQILSITERFASLLADVDVVCECADPACVSTIRIATSTFANVRATKETFIVLPGHERPDVEHVVEQTRHYVVVGKAAQAVTDAESR
jgi:hypothetical protein